jgi:hypothetical protein
MIPIEAYSNFLATLHSAPLDDDHWRQLVVQIP